MFSNVDTVSPDILITGGTKTWNKTLLPDELLMILTIITSSP